MSEQRQTTQSNKATQNFICLLHHSMSQAYVCVCVCVCIMYPSLSIISLEGNTSVVVLLILQQC
jgi:hypothetical protein